MYAVLQKPLVIPESMPALRLLEVFKQSGTRLAVVIDEYGGTQGLVTLTDISRQLLAPSHSRAGQRSRRR